MAAYAYTAINAEGLELSGELQAPTAEAAREQLRVRGLLAEQLKELQADGSGAAGAAPAQGVGGFMKTVKPRSLQVFSRQFATMIDAGPERGRLPADPRGPDHRRLPRRGDRRRACGRGGRCAPLPGARQVPKIFSRLYVAMVEAGEAAGILDEVLDRLATQIEKEANIKRRVKGAMVYPTLVLSFSFVVLTAMLLFIVPIFQKLYLQLGGTLPSLTQVIVNVSVLMRTRSYLVFPAIALVLFGFFRWKKSEGGKKVWGPVQAEGSDEDRRHRPEGGDGAVRTDTLDPGLRGRRHHQVARDHGRDGRQLGRRGGPPRRTRASPRRSADSPTLVEHPVFPPMVSQMVKIGEETGELDSMLGKIADFYEEEVDASISALTSIIEPIMIIMVGAVIGTIIISMYLPMFKLLTLIK